MVRGFLQKTYNFVSPPGPLYRSPIPLPPIYILLIYNFYIKKYGPLDPLRKNPYISSLRSINLDPIPIGSTLDPLDHFAVLT